MTTDFRSNTGQTGLRVDVAKLHVASIRISSSDPSSKEDFSIPICQSTNSETLDIPLRQLKNLIKEFFCSLEHNIFNTLMKKTPTPLQQHPSHHKLSLTRSVETKISEHSPTKTTTNFSNIGD